MATLQKLRTQAGLFLAIVIFIALAAFILGDLLKSGTSIMQRRKMEIAEIEGESIKYPDFQVLLEEKINIQKQNSGTTSIDDATYNRVLNQTWDALIKEKLLGEVFVELGIDITSSEMFDMVQGNNLHPYMAQLFGDPNTGQVDKTAIIRFLKYIQENPDAPQRANWLSIEQQIVLDKKEKKYNDLVAKGMYANSLQAEKSLIEKNRTVNLKFVKQQLSTVSDSTIQVSDAELKNYYNKHKGDFERNETRKIAYIIFDIEPSEDDDIDTRNWIKGVESDFRKSDDNIRFVNRNADTRFEDVYQTESMLTSEIRDFAFDAEIGEVYGPIKQDRIYKLYKLNDIKMLPDSVKASHILIRIANESDELYASNVIDSLQNIIESGQATFEQLAKDNSADTGSGAMGGDVGWFKRGQMVAPFEKASFRGEVGELIKVKTQFGYHLIQVKKQGAKSKHVQLAIVDREVIASSKTSQDLYAKASTFAAQSKNYKGLIEQAKEHEYNARNANIKDTDRSITGIGSARTIVRSAFFQSDEGELVKDRSNAVVFEMIDKFIVAAVEEVFEKGHRPFEDVAVQAELRSAVSKEKKKEVLANKFAAAKKTTIEETASELGLEVENAEGFRLSYGQLNTVGNEQAINGALINLSVDQLSNPIIGSNGVYFVVITKIDDKESGDIVAERKSLAASNGYRVSYQAYNTIKENAEIVDKRTSFY